MEHKKVLFDEILAPSKEAIAEKKAQHGNRVRYIVFGILKWIAVVIISIIGSLVLSAVVTAIVQERSFSAVISEFTDKVLNLLKT